MNSFSHRLRDHSYQQLGAIYFSEQAPTPVSDPKLIRVNAELVEFFDLEQASMREAETINLLAGNAAAEKAKPIASVYGGHQFGVWNPGLGDGRAILIGELEGKDGQLYDIQLKGAGRTPYSRGGDGRSPIGPVLREYLVSEAFVAMGIPSTRALAAISTGEKVARERWLPGGILTRVARSHIRVGTFQYFMARDQLGEVKALADYVIKRHYDKAIRDQFADDPYFGLLCCVVEAQASLIAKWLSIGFIHGVMNTDNMLLSGETVDFGPCAFLDQYESDKVYSSIDRHGRYAFDQQAMIAQWNLAWLGQALMPLINGERGKVITKLEELLGNFQTRCDENYQTFMAKKLGFVQATEQTQSLVTDLLSLMQRHDLDFTNTFRMLAEQLVPDQVDRFTALMHLPEDMTPWMESWRSQLQTEGIDFSDAQQSMNMCNPAVIPRNHQIEKAIQEAMHEQRYDHFNRLADVLNTPYDLSEENFDLAKPPEENEVVTKTFCGT